MLDKMFCASSKVLHHSPIISESVLHQLHTVLQRRTDDIVLTQVFLPKPFYTIVIHLLFCHESLLTGSQLDNLHPCDQSSIVSTVLGQESSMNKFTMNHRLKSFRQQFQI